MSWWHCIHDRVFGPKYPIVEQFQRNKKLPHDRPYSHHVTLEKAAFFNCSIVTASEFLVCSLSLPYWLTPSDVPAEVIAHEDYAYTHAHCNFILS